MNINRKGVFLNIKNENVFKHGPGNWKFNNILQDEKYIETTESSFPKILHKYKQVESHHLLSELVNMEIRSITMIYSKTKKQSFRAKELILQKEIDKLDQETCGSNTLNNGIMDRYDEAKEQLKEI